MNKKKFAIIGTGVVGTALAVLLEKAGFECIGVNTRSHFSYERFRKYLQREHMELDQICLQADYVFITTHDGSIETVAEKLTEHKRNMKKAQLWVHCSGSMKSEIMCKDPSLPVNYLSIHPLQAFANIESALCLISGTHFGIEGDTEKSEAIGETLVKILGGIPHRIDPMRKTLYHAGAVAASNYLVSLAYLAVKLFGQAGIPQGEALESLLPLMKGAYQNIAKVGLPCALTGPIARGDTAVVARHLQEMPPELLDTYKGLGKLALELGKERKRLSGDSYDTENLAKLQNLLI
ncbi:MAG: DUF2520 domain-containing protein [Peptococcaceae bacterium]|nr:DUF2520 domain-containing protein [Peptococcaceae bacterium]